MSKGRSAGLTLGAYLERARAGERVFIPKPQTPEARAQLARIPIDMYHDWFVNQSRLVAGPEAITLADLVGVSTQKDQFTVGFALDLIGPPSISEVKRHVTLYDDERRRIGRYKLVKGRWQQIVGADLKIPIFDYICTGPERLEFKVRDE